MILELEETIELKKILYCIEYDIGRRSLFICQCWDDRSVNWPYYGNHFIISYAYWIIILYSFNLHNVTCQIYLHKAGKKGKRTKIIQN